MAYSPPRAVYDACVLYPFHLRNLLIQCAADRLVEARWSAEIHDEWIRNLAADTPGLTVERLTATRDLMDRVLPDANVVGHERHLPNINLPDPDDRHVVAAAIEAEASIIVTWNLRDFPAAELRRHGLRKMTPDALMVALHETAPAAVIAATANARRNLRVSRISVADYLAALERQRLKRFVAAIEPRARFL